MADGSAGQRQYSQADNDLASLLIRKNAIEMTQSIFSTTIANPGTTANVVNVQPRNVGLIKGFWIELNATIAITNVNNGTRTSLGAANLLSQIVFNDLNNNVRINTSGWHLALLNSAKRQWPFGAAVVNSSLFTTPPITYGDIYGDMKAPASITKNTSSSAIRFFYFVPLAYSDDDLRGSIYSNVVNATQQLQLTINPAPVVDGTAVDNVTAVYDAGSGGGGSISSITINVYQVYMDQLPIGKQGPVLPLFDLSTIYEIKNTQLSGIAANQDFPIPYANFRQFLSTFAIFDNGSTQNAGTDVNYWALQSANFTNIFKLDPFVQTLKSRNILGTDFPVGAYYFDYRRKPWSTIQYGNLELILNASSVAGSGVVQCLVGFESFALVNQITGAGSLAAG